MTTPLPELLRHTAEHLTDDDRGQLPELVSQIVDHPALAPLLHQTPEPEQRPVTPPLPAVVLAKLICEINNINKPFRSEDGEQQWHTNCIAVQRLIFLSHGYHLDWYGQPLVDEDFEIWGRGPSLASLRALPGWGTCAEDAPAVMAAGTSVASHRQLSMVTEIVRAHGTWGSAISERVAKYPLVVAGDVSETAIRRHFALQAAGLDKKEFDQTGRVAARADAVEALVDEETRAELLRRWLS